MQRCKTVGRHCRPLAAVKNGCSTLLLWGMPVEYCLIWTFLLLLALFLCAVRRVASFSAEVLHNDIEHVELVSSVRLVIRACPSISAHETHH